MRPRLILGAFYSKSQTPVDGQTSQPVRLVPAFLIITGYPDSNIAPYFSFLRVCLKAGKQVLLVDPDDMFTYMGYIGRELRMAFNTSSHVSSSALCCYCVPSFHPFPAYILTLVFFNIQCFAAISLWAKLRPDVIAGVGSPHAKRKRLRNSIQVAEAYWNKSEGILRPFKTTPIMNDFLMTILSPLDLSVPIDLRDSLLFNVAFVSGARAMEACNITWKDVTILGGGEAVLIHIRPSKNSTLLGSIHTAQFGRRTRHQVSR